MNIRSLAARAWAILIVAGLAFTMGTASAHAGSATKNDKRGDVKVIGKIPKKQRADARKVKLRWTKNKAEGDMGYLKDVYVQTWYAKNLPQTGYYSLWIQLDLEGVKGKYALARGMRPGGKPSFSTMPDVYRKKGKKWVALGCVVHTTEPTTRNFRIKSTLFAFDSDCLRRSPKAKLPSSIRAKVTVNTIRWDRPKNYTKDTVGWTKRVRQG